MQTLCMFYSAFLLMLEQIWGLDGVFLGRRDRGPFQNRMCPACVCVLFCYSEAFMFLGLARDLRQRPKRERCFP